LVAGDGPDERHPRRNLFAMTLIEQWNFMAKHNATLLIKATP
jgi:hypothetical protein